MSIPPVLKSPCGPLVTLWLLCGCHSTLQPGGAYAPGNWSTNSAGILNFMPSAAPDLQLYQADAAFLLSDRAIHGAFSIELANRQLLWEISPSIKHTLDQLRPRVLEAEIAWATARQAYLAAPVPANLSAVQLILARLQRLEAVATATISIVLSTP